MKTFIFAVALSLFAAQASAQQGYYVPNVGPFGHDTGGAFYNGAGKMVNRPSIFGPNPAPGTPYCGAFGC